MPLTQQATSDDVEFLKTVSNEDILNTRDSNDLSVLHHAVLKDQQDCVEVICERCPELVYHQAKFFSNMTALMLAVERGHPSMVQTIFEASIKVDRDSNGGKKLLRMKDTDARSALWWAVCSNHLEVTKFLLEKDPEFEHGPDVNGNTLLMAAEQYAKSNYPDAGKILDLVIEHLKRNEGDGSEGTKQTIGSSTHEMHPIKQPLSEDVDFLKTVSNEDILNTRDSNDLSVLHHAVLKDQRDCVEVICERCPELVYHQAKLFSNMTTLMLAAERGHLSMVQTIFEASIKVERDSNGGKKLLRMKDADARTALWWAVCSNQLEVTKFLLEKDPDFEHGHDVNGNTLLMAAEQYAKSDYPDAGKILDLVIDHLKRNEGDGMHQIEHIMPEEVEFLKTVSQEDLLNARDSNDLSALHHAILKDQQDCVQVICERCSELVYHQAKSVFNMTPLMLAAERGHLSMVQTIFEASIKVERDSNGGKKLLWMKDTDARSALWWAVCSNQFEVTKFLLEKDPEFEHGPDVNGNTLLMAAEQYAKSNYPDAGRILELVMEHQKRKEQRGTVLHHEQISIPTNPSPKGDGGIAGKDNRPSETTESDESPSHNTTEKLEVLGREDISSTPANVPAPSADVSLWRNKKISAGVLGAATAAWVLFELLEYHLLTLVCHALILSLALLFLWSNANKFIKGSAPNIPSVSLPEKQVLEVASALTKEINYALVVLREIASGCDLKMFLSVVSGLWVLSIVGGWCNFMTLFYIAFVLLHTVHAVMNSTSVAVPAPPEPTPPSDLQGDLIIVLLVLLIAIAVKVLIKI